MQKKRIIYPLAAFISGAGIITGIYFGIVSLAESPNHAVEFFVDELRLVLPLIIGFGIQSSLYIILKKQLFVPISDMGGSGAVTGAGGTTSAVAMVACCAHHVTDVLPILGISGAAIFLTKYQDAFMFIGLVTMVIGILVMIRILLVEREKILGGRTSKTDRLNHKAFMALSLAAGVIGIVALNPFRAAASSFAPPESSSAIVEDVEMVGDYPQSLEPVPSSVELWFSGSPKIDQQGAVVVEVRPLHLNMKNQTLYFGIAMNTHSVDLSMDLAKLATLDSGTVISAEFWDAPAGGHHVSGVLSFVLSEAEIEAIKEAHEIQFSIVDVDAAERLFVWQNTDS